MFAKIALGLAALVTPLRASPIAHPAHCLDVDRARDAVARGDARPFDEIARGARTSQRGEIVAARLCPAASGLIYVVILLEKGGVVARIVFDAATGEASAVPAAEQGGPSGP